MQLDDNAMAEIDDFGIEPDFEVLNDDEKEASGVGKPR
jgi:hypothetical protein